MICSKCKNVVTAAPIICSECQTAASPAAVEAIMEVLCEQYCKWPETLRDQEEMTEKCDSCQVEALLKIIAIGDAAQ